MTAHSSVYAAFQYTAGRFSDRPFLHIPAEAARAYSGGAIDLTYGEAQCRIDGLARRYAATGIGVGSRVALMLDNRPDFFLHWIALNALGVSIVPLNGEATAPDLAYIVDDAAPVFAVALAARLPQAMDVMAAAKKPIPVIPCDQLSALDALPRRQDPQTPTADTECGLLYTSGSTGAPKGCMLSNTYFLLMGEWYGALDGHCAMGQGTERLLTPLPLTHMNALATSTMAMILTGGCIIQLDRFHPTTWWKTVAESRATIVHYLGVLPAILLNLPEIPEERSHLVRFGFGAGVNPKHQAPFEKRYGFPLIEAWSMTEVGAAAVVIANREPRHIGTSCFGKPEAFMEWRLVDEQGMDVEPGKAGELLVRRAGDDPRFGFFSGYWGKPEETAKAWNGGWFHTGDSVRQGEDGSLHFVDRIKSIIRRSGENISSLEVEAVLSQIDGVKAVGAAPVPDDIRGEEVFVAIVLADGRERSQQEAERIATTAADSLTYYKVPGYIAFMDALPLTASQKLQRGELKTKARTLVERGDVFDVRHLKSRKARKAG